MGVIAERVDPDGWLQLAPVRLNSGRWSSYKIECDHLSDAEVQAACALLAEVLPPFGWVSGVPTGGDRLAEAMKPFASDDRGPLLIIDDVWTTGGSVERHRSGFGAIPTVVGVLIARGPTPPDVTALLTLHEGLWEA